MKKYIVARMLSIALLCLATTIGLHAQTFTTIFSFDGRNTDGPVALTQGNDGRLYGTGNSGGANGQHNPTQGDGTAFGMTTDGTLTALYSFCSQPFCADGLLPLAGMTLAVNGNFYGITQSGGIGGSSCNSVYGCGSIFVFNSVAKPSRLYSFCSAPNCADGETPEEPMVEGFNGSLYGNTFYGGNLNNCQGGCGTIFKVTPSGQLTTLHTFCQSGIKCPDGSNPQAPLVLGSDGNFYGGANGGSAPTGTLFRITPNGTFTKMHQFNRNTDGDDPTGLVLGNDGNFYGTAAFYGNGPFCIGAPCGTVFKITPTGQFTTLYNFCSQANCADGGGPYSGIIQGTDGNFYGTTIEGGTNVNNTVCFGRPCGVLFQVTPTGQYTVLYNFCAQANCTDGTGGGTLMQATDGKFYGTTSSGGLSGSCNGYGCGTIFSLDMGLSPFVKPNPWFGKTGTSVNIQGNNLTGTTAVTFDGVAATFTVTSDTLIKATVPAGATTGSIQVTAPNGTLSSNVAFQVLP